MTDKLKQLKKNDFLKIVTEAPMTKGQIVEALDEYQFIGSYLDYLIEHFVSFGKIVQNEDGTYSRKLKKSSMPKAVYRVTDDEEGGHVMKSKEVTGLLSDKDKAEGWSTTENAAVKKASSFIFAQYKKTTESIKSVLTPVTKSDEDIAA